MYNMDKESKAYLSGEFNEFFLESEVGSLAKEDFVEYRKSNLKYWEDQAIVDYATHKSMEEGREIGLELGRKEGREEGREIGLELGRKEGKNEEKMAIAKNMLDMGMALELISKATGMSVEELRDL